MNTSNASIILIEDESSCESISCNCKELIAAITKRQRMEREHEAIRNNVYISDSDDVDNDDTRESYSSKRARWYQEDMERNDCLTTIWKMDDKLVRLLTHGTEDMPDSPDLEYTPASPDPDNSNDSEESYGAAGEELVRFLTHGSKDMPASPCEYSPASPDCDYNPDESIRATPDSSPKSPAKAWCYECDDDFDFCPCQCPWSPSITYNPCEVCESERCTCLKLPIKTAEIDYITLD